MKTFTLTLILAFALTLSASAFVQDSLLDKQLDSVHYALLKPRMEKYISKAEELSNQIKSSSDRKSVRLYSKELQLVTDSILETADKIYGYRKISGSGPGYVILPNGTISNAYIPRPDVETTVCPDVHQKLDDLSGVAETMRWFPASKKSRMRKADRLIHELKHY